MSAADSPRSDATPFAAPVPGRARKRAEALVPLSRDHHQALKQAMDLERARAETAQSTWESCVEFWECEGNSHFIEEECELLPTYARGADPNHPALVTARPAGRSLPHEGDREPRGDRAGDYPTARRVLFCSGRTGLAMAVATEASVT